jgi:hypothetical protein
MSKKPNLPQNPLLAELLAKKVEGAVTYMGYIGPEEYPDHIILYESLTDLSKSLDIKKSDVLHYAEAPKTILPFGGVILWLKKDSEVISRPTAKKEEIEGANSIIAPIRDAAVSVKSDRLNLTIEKASVSVGLRIPPPCRRPPCRVIPW